MGILKRDKETYLKRFPYVSDDDFDPMFQRARFSCLLICDKPHCAEVVALTGNITFQQFHDNDGDLIESAELNPLSMIPGSPIIKIPRQTPDAVRAAIVSSFSVFWSDRAAAANRLRMSVERILDHEGIPKLGFRLAPRIERFAQKYPDQKDTLEALRWVGNVGSHDDDVSREALLDAYEVYDYWLRNFYGREKAAIDAKVQRLIDTKGKYGT
ncbi:DUF4145 domain-containing protein [Mesorhizobium sp. LNHC209A00]|uniref:DUF4145 domain-containing protein n=1 Tax=Mesorhizobium TaxID=68287 RepID=UPI0003D05C2E|nr:DUF4145 domain-containing protein [Mesorhizobium sp. LNHC209A00]ESY98058.1 hypothetical protein X738_17575 [Mesorhizobium sp. LNHC209A00]